ncbi:hypothetical protein SALWKB12_1064 [Snodgrassella communis]|nr:hypothetical protein SALWKB12_1064 [Snodgrassella communis]
MVVFQQLMLARSGIFASKVNCWFNRLDNKNPVNANGVFITG